MLTLILSIISGGLSRAQGQSELWALRNDDLAAVAPSAAMAFRFNDQLEPKPIMHIKGETQ